MRAGALGFLCMNLKKAAVSVVLLVFVSAALLADDAAPVVHYRPENPDADSSAAAGKAVSAVLVKSTEGQWPYEGNVQVTYSNGQTVVVTTDGRDSKPKVVGGGIVGWVNAVGHDEKYGSVKTVLLLKSPDGKVKTWECNAIFIEDWGLVDNDTHPGDPVDAASWERFLHRVRFEDGADAEQDRGLRGLCRSAEVGTAVCGPE